MRGSSRIASKLQLLGVATWAACLIGCSRTTNTARLAPAVGYEPGFNKRGDARKPRELLENDPANAPRLTHNAVVSFVRSTNVPPQPLGLKIQVATDRSGLAFEDKQVTPAMISGNSFLVHLRDIQGGIDHSRYIKFTVHDPTDNSDREYWVRYQKRVTVWNGVASPVLYKFDGSIGSFGLANLAPSVAAGPRLNFDGQSDTYLGFDGLLTVYKSAAATDAGSRPYSLAIGSVLDVSGFFQVGATYHFKDSRWAAVIGLRPEVLSRLTGN